MQPSNLQFAVESHSAIRCVPFNKRSPTQVSPKPGFLGEADFETKFGKGRRYCGTDYSCSEFHGAKTGFLSPTVREIFLNENGKNREIYNSPLQSASIFSVDRPNKKKIIVRKISLCLPLFESQRIFFNSIIGRDMNDLVRYPFGMISKSFYSALPLGLFTSFHPPSCMIHINNKERREQKDKNTEGGSERHNC